MYMFIINTTYWHTDIYEYVNIQMCTSTFPFFCFQFLNLLVLQVQIGGANLPISHSRIIRNAVLKKRKKILH